MNACRKLTDQDRIDILALKGQVVAPTAAERFGISANTVYAIWQQRYRAGSLGRPKRRLTPELRREIIALKASGMLNRDIMAQTGFGECTVTIVIREAREDGVLRPAGSAVVADTAGAGNGFPDAKPAPVAPPRMMIKLTDTVRRMRDSLKAKGMAPEMALREALRINAGRSVQR